MNLSGVISDMCYEITNSVGENECMGISCESLFCGSREEWLWACQAAYRHWFCTPYKKRYAGDNTESHYNNTLDLIENDGWEVRPIDPDDTLFTNATEIFDIASFQKYISANDSDISLNAYIDAVTSPLLRSFNKKRCEESCKSADNFMRHCQLNGITIVYTVAKSACIAACYKKYGNGHTNCKK